MAKTKLKPCPFCGGEPDVYGDRYWGYWVACHNDDCGVVASGKWVNTKREAIKCWNTRKG